MRQVGEEQHGGSPEHLGVRPQQTQGSLRVRLAPSERSPPVLRERLRKNEDAIQRIGQAQPGRDPEWKAQVDGPEHAAKGRPGDEAEGKRRADHAESGGPAVRVRDVGDIGERGGETGRGQAPGGTADQQPAHPRSDRHKQVVEAER